MIHAEPKFGLIVTEYRETRTRWIVGKILEGSIRKLAGAALRVASEFTDQCRSRTDRHGREAQLPISESIEQAIHARKGGSRGRCPADREHGQYP